MSSALFRKKPKLNEVPYIVSDSRTQRVFTKGRFLGKGGFARCYELIDNATKQIYAGKIVSKLLLVEKHQQDKMTQEVEIHRGLSHVHIVQMFHCFEDVENVYVLLELCSRRSLMDLHKRRRIVTEPEARYFTNQIVLACGYLHDKKIIHRDLKLGNLFLNDDMQLKIGDFGLATTMKSEGELKRTVCGTPNYIAPEMLDKKGYAFEVDIWAIGCILFTLLIGKPPFEAGNLKDTYARIRKNQYVIPLHIGRDATILIKKLLAMNPAQRPKVHEILKAPFFTEGFLPQRLPTSCLTMSPKFNVKAVSGGEGDFTRPADVKSSHTSNSAKLHAFAAQPEMSSAYNQKQDAASVLVTQKAPGEQINYLQELFTQLTNVINSCSGREMTENIVEVQDPAASPIYWVAKWLNYSSKYGLGYQLCDGSIGILFNDSTKIILDAAGEQLQYTERNDAKFYHTLQRYPPSLGKKVSLLRYFQCYMEKHLLQAGENIFRNPQRRDGDELARLPCLQAWYWSKSEIVFYLSNGTLQLNFFQDHTKLILCPLLGAATCISTDKSVATFKFSLLERYGCPEELLIRLKNTKIMIEQISARVALRQSGNGVIFNQVV